MELNICGINFKQYEYEDIDKYKDYSEFLRKDECYGYVYIIVCNGIIKIGKSTQPNSRIISQINRLDKMFRHKIKDSYEYYAINTIFISECFMLYPKLEAILKQNLKQYSYNSSEVFKINFDTFKQIVTNIDISEFNTDLNRIKDKIIAKFNTIIKQEILFENDIKFIGINFDTNGVIKTIDIKWRNNWGKYYDDSVKRLQMEGVAKAKSNGVKFGRPKLELPDNFEEVCTRWRNGEITATKAMELTNMKRTNFYKQVKLLNL